MSDYLRLALGGLLLELPVFHAQRDAPNGLRRGVVLVLLTSLAVALAAFVGGMGQRMTSPDPDLVIQTVYDGIIAMPWYRDVIATDPGFTTRFREQFDRNAQLSRLLLGGGVSKSLSAVVAQPFVAVLGWLVFGALAHLLARAMGGRGTLAQTLACTALAAGANMLNLVQLVPYAQPAGATLLGLMISYVALREVHSLSPWRALTAVLAGPLLLALLLIGLACLALPTLGTLL